MEDLCVLTGNGHVIGGQIGVYVTAQWNIKNVASDDLLRLSVFAPKKRLLCPLQLFHLSLPFHLF